jgi:hypothetical protein
MGELRYSESVDAPSTHLIEALLAREDATGARHVLWEGRVEEMVGGTAAHYRLSVQLLFQFMSVLGDAFDTFQARYLQARGLSLTASRCW